MFLLTWKRNLNILQWDPYTSKGANLDWDIAKVFDLNRFYDLQNEVSHHIVKVCDLSATTVTYLFGVGGGFLNYV